MGVSNGILASIWIPWLLRMFFTLLYGWGTTVTFIRNEDVVKKTKQKSKCPQPLLLWVMVQGSWVMENGSMNTLSRVVIVPHGCRWACLYCIDTVIPRLSEALEQTCHYLFKCFCSCIPKSAWNSVWMGLIEIYAIRLGSLLSETVKVLHRRTYYKTSLDWSEDATTTKAQTEKVGKGF